MKTNCITRCCVNQLITRSRFLLDPQNLSSSSPKRDSGQEGGAGGAAGGPVTQIIYTNSPATHSSLDVAREREDALTKNDMFWQKRINQIEVANNKSAQILEKEYNQSVSPEGEEGTTMGMS